METQSDIMAKLRTKPVVKTDRQTVRIKVPGPTSGFTSALDKSAVKVVDKTSESKVDRGRFKRRRSATDPPRTMPRQPIPSPTVTPPQTPLAAEEPTEDSAFEANMMENIKSAREQLGLSPIEEGQETKTSDEQPAATPEVLAAKPKPPTATPEALATKPKPVVAAKVKVTDKRTKTTRARRTRAPDEGIFMEVPDSAIAIKDVTLAERLPKSEKFETGISSYFMNNREIFINFINSVFGQYKDQLMQEESDTSCLDISMDRPFSLLTHQKIVRDYLNLYTPYRGLLLYHGLGSGKTCSSIAIAEGLKVKNDVIVMTPASLRRNYIEEIKKCGDELYKKRQYWEFIKTQGDPQLERTLSSVLRLPLEYIRKAGGVWMVDASKPANVDDLSKQDRISLDMQIEMMIAEKYQFISYNGLSLDHLKDMTNDFTLNPFDNKVVIIDEAHNLVSRIVGKMGNAESISHKLYEYLLSAKNCRIVLLTGTPMINYPNEIGVLFNILRGYITTWKFNLDASNQRVVDRGDLEEMFSKDEKLRDVVDFVDYDNNSKVITITRNPVGFVNDTVLGAYEGVSVNEQGQLDDSDFVRLITTILSKNRIKVVPGESGTHVVKFKALPDTREEFINMFIDESTGEMKDADKFKRRILGLASYFPDIAKLMPRYSGEMCVVEVDMSDYQFGKYETERDRERKMERKKPKKKASGGDIYDDSASTYKIFSRAFCNFVFPEAIGRPKLKKDADVVQGEEEEAAVAAALTEVDQSEERRRLLSEIDSLQKDATAAEDADARTIQDRVEQLERTLSDMEQELADDNAIVEIDASIHAKETDMADGPSPNSPIPKSKIREVTEYQDRIKAALLALEEGSSTYLSKDGLETYSPKFLQILENVQDPEFAGLHLLYSQFRTVEGIAIFALILKYNGFAEFKIRKKADGSWYLAKRMGFTQNGGIVWGDLPPEDMDKPKFVLYTGTEDPMEKEIIRNIFNSNWDMIPPELRKVITEMPDVVYPVSQRTTQNECAKPKGKATRKLKMKAKKGTRKNKGVRAAEPGVAEPGAAEPDAAKPAASATVSTTSGSLQTNNHMGEIIKLFMITASGAEGISLKSVRYVHLTEPYWNPIRLEQVIGRARRICSHEFLPDALNDVVVFLYMMVFTEHQLKDLASQELKLKDKGKIDIHTPITTDQALYEIANIKYDIAKQLFQNIKEASIDCVLHNREGSGNELNCYSFGNPSSALFSYQPSIFGEESDQVRKGNKTVAAWRAQEANIRGKKYIINSTLTISEPKKGKKPEDPYNEVYDYNSYQDYIRTNGKMPLVPVGKLVRPLDGKPKFKALVKKTAKKDV